MDLRFLDAVAEHRFVFPVDGLRYADALARLFALGQVDGGEGGA
jgi:hypothetical protein